MSFLNGTDPSLRQTRTPTTQEFTGSGQSSVTLSADPGSEDNVIITFDGVVQHRSTYSVSGTTLSFSSAVPTGVAKIEATFTTTHAIQTPSANSVTGAKIADDSIDSEHYVAASIDNEHLADDAVGVAELSATGTASASTFLRGDNAWAAPSAGFTLGTEAASTGTSVGFTGIPSGTKQIIITFEEIVCSGSSNDLIVEIGDADGLETSGYVGIGARISDANRATSTSYYAIHGQSTGATSGHFVLTLSDSSNNTWIASHTFRNADNVFVGGGAKSLSAVLTQVRIDPGGAQSFSSGAFNVQYIS